MPKEFFSPKKNRRSVSDIIPPPELGERALPKTAPRPSASIDNQRLSASKDFDQRPSASTNLRIPKWPFISLLLIAVFAGLVYVALEFLPRVEIKIFLKKYPLVFNEAVEVNKNFSSNQSHPTSTIIKLPAELFTERRNLQMSFPANGKQKIEKKAQGKLTIYNSYSSDPQVLVADTRFFSPDNKIFRLNKAVTVPGAKIQEGKIVPSSIEVGVTADQPGAEYNIGPVAKFTIPGLKGSPKYEGFYAKSDQSMAGGFVGEKAVPTDKDIEDAKAKIKQALEDVLKAAIFPQLPRDFKVVDGASRFEILSEKVEKEVDKENKFSVFSEAQTKLIVFREKDLRDILISRLLPQLASGDYEAIDFNIEYGLPRSDFEKGEMSFPVKGQINFQRKISPELFRQQALGKDEQALKALVFSLPGLEKAQISFWPMYVRKAPNKIEKIKVTIQ
jgi:hypothetical protein